MLLLSKHSLKKQKRLANPCGERFMNEGTTEVKLLGSSNAQVLVTRTSRPTPILLRAVAPPHDGISCRKPIPRDHMRKENILCPKGVPFVSDMERAARAKRIMAPH